MRMRTRTQNEGNASMLKIVKGYKEYIYAKIRSKYEINWIA